MRTRIRKWRHAILLPVLGLVGVIMLNPPNPSLLFAADVILGALTISYVAEEIAWNLRGRGKPCTHCGHEIPVQSFYVYNTCPGCGQQL